MASPQQLSHPSLVALPYTSVVPSPSPSLLSVKQIVASINLVTLLANKLTSIEMQAQREKNRVTIVMKNIL